MMNEKTHWYSKQSIAEIQLTSNGNDLVQRLYEVEVFKKTLRYPKNDPP